jgi:hypothetical protein
MGEKKSSGNADGFVVPARACKNAAELVKLSIRSAIDTVAAAIQNTIYPIHLRSCPGLIYRQF